ncbi:MAG: hypothetical protein HOP19_25660, partial [Acidobacteria bacterium]|nr:hypothetical protein [Acidobacteriota bacterium]
MVCLLAVLCSWSQRQALDGSVVAQTTSCGNFAWDARFNGEQGVNGIVLAIAQAPTGEVFVGGRFTRAGNVNANNIAYWHPTGGWRAFEQGNGQNGVGGVAFAEVTALAVSGETVYVGGRFTQAGGLPANNVASWTYRNGWQALAGNGGNGVGGTGAPQVYALALDKEDVYV